MILAVAGHVDHGKTHLVQALTQVDCDRLSEEKRRGISIELGFARWALSEPVSIIDLPGHERLLRTMLLGAGAAQAVLLVVAAHQGVMPQTREHLAACQLLGFHQGVIAMSFSDRVEDLEAAVARIRRDLQGSALAKAPIIPVCAPQGFGLEALSQAVEALPRPQAALHLPLCLPIDRSFSLTGQGSVVTGSLIRGQLRLGEQLQVNMGPLARIRGIEIHGEAVQAAQAGQRVALNLNLPQKALPRGAVLSNPGQLLEGRLFDAELELLPQARLPLYRARGLNLHLAARQALVEIRADEPIPPGGRGLARLRLDRVIPLPAGARFVLRGPRDLHWGSVFAGGRLLDSQPPRRRRAEQRRRLLDPEEGAALLIEESRRRGLRPEEVSPRLLLPSEPPGPPRFAPKLLERERVQLIAQVQNHHRENSAAPGLPYTPPDLLARYAEREARERGELLRAGPALRQPEHSPRLDRRGKRLAHKLIKVLSRVGLEGISQGELEKRFPVQPQTLRLILSHLAAQERVVLSQGRCFPGREALAFRASVQRQLQISSLGLGEICRLTKISRRQALPLLAWLDSSGITQRQGALRISGLISAPASKHLT